MTWVEGGDDVDRRGVMLCGDVCQMVDSKGDDRSISI